MNRWTCSEDEEVYLMFWSGIVERRLVFLGKSGSNLANLSPVEAIDSR